MPENASDMGLREHVWAVAVSITIAVFVALPGVRLLLADDAPDGFPLSTYPMFTSDPGRVVEMATVVVLDEDGTAERLSPRTIAGTDQVIQAWVTVRAAVRAGPGAAEELCLEVAGRVSPSGASDTPVEVAVVVEQHDAIAWSADSSADPLERRIVAACESVP